ncbi:MAG: peptide deformylase [Bryobacteraceae bacterium]|nr:peptide deformylase [Bryobacteraceae bacterium]
MPLPIVKYGDPILERRADTITQFTAELQQLIDEMFETMYAAKGVGLAAPQVGISQRLTVIDTSVGEDPTAKIVLINPEIISKEGSQTGEEGCLSIPGFREPVTRAMKTTVRAQNAQGESFEISGEELLSRAFQHEIDHLNGVLFIQHLSPLKRDLIRRKIRKLQKSGDWD